MLCLVIFWRVYDDAKIALEMQKEEILKKERNRIKLELEDQVIATPSVVSTFWNILVVYVCFDEIETVFKQL